MRRNVAHILLVVGVAVRHGVAVNDPGLPTCPDGVWRFQPLGCACNTQQLARRRVVVGPMPSAPVGLWPGRGARGVSTWYSLVL